MELKRYDDFSDISHLEEKIEEIIDLFPDIDDIVEIFYSLDGFDLKSAIPTLYKGSLFYKTWGGGVYIDSYSYFNIDKTGDKYKIEELYFQEIIYPKQEFEYHFNKKWRNFGLRFFEIKNDKVRAKDYLAPCFKVKIKIDDPNINSYTWRHDDNFIKLIKEMNRYLENNQLKWILLDDVKDSNLNIIVISNRYIKD
jgi:hypothetical protein